ncbi:MAG: DUF6658 family protein [Planktothrix sp. GU0601_MAG3]|nr:MAG: DUF6658 family protein [Planktothrix sp. GU0601_MAG3]
MQKLTQALRSISFKNILGVFFAGLLMLISTACSNNPPTAQSSGEGNPNQSKGLTSELPSPVKSNQKTEMYAFDNSDQDIVKRVKDVSEKVSNSASEVAGDLMKGTQKNIQKAEDNTKQALNQVQKAAEETSKDIKSQASKGAGQVKDKAGDFQRQIQKS